MGFKINLKRKSSYELRLDHYICFWCPVLDTREDKPTQQKLVMFLSSEEL